MIIFQTVKFKTLALLVCVAICNMLSAQQEQYQFNLVDIKNGLSNNQVNTIFKDDKGFVWIGTMSGLNKYDGYKFKTFRHKNGDTTSINDDYINQISPGPKRTLWVQTRSGWNIFDPHVEKFTSRIAPFLNSIGIDTSSLNGFSIWYIKRDDEKNFWFILPGKGLYKINAATNRATFYNSSSRSCPLYSNKAINLAPDHHGCIWIIYSDGMLEKLDLAANRIVMRSHQMQLYADKPDYLYKLFVDNESDLWIYCSRTENGVYHYSTSADRIFRINKESKDFRLNSNVISGITQDYKNNIWIATDHGGVNLLNKKAGSVRYLINNEGDKKSISDNSVNSIYKDSTGIIWLGTFKKGINFFHQSSLKFPLYQHKLGDAKSLLYNDVNRFAEDKKGNLWIGTNGGGLIYFNRASGIYTQYLHHSSSNSLSNNVIVSLFIDKQDKVWIGTYFGGLDCFDGKTFTHYRHDDKNTNSLADNRVWEILEDSESNLWLGTFSEGVDMFDRKANKFIHYKPGGKTTLKSGYVSSLIEDTEGALWIGTSIGIDVLNRKTGTFTHYEHVENDNTSLSQNNVTGITQDSRGLIWVGTRDGLDLFDPSTKVFKTFNAYNGLPDNAILDIIEDNDRNLWISTPNGLSKAVISAFEDKPLSLQFKNYDETDGLQGRQFNESAALKTSKGEMVFGGPDGFNIFDPKKIVENKSVPDLVFTDLQIFNSSIVVGEEYNGLVVLPQTISEAKEIILKYNQNVFTIGFSALSFLNFDKIKYAYKLEGFSREWLTTDSKNRNATFTNLNPGNYTLLVKGCNEDGVWSSEPLALNIKIFPPFWLTPFAFILYVLIIIAALIFARNQVLHRAKLKFQIEQERLEAQRLHNLDLMKMKFFTNVSHEFRTPLSLIITPIEKLIKESAQLNNKKQFELIHRNARRLLNLVNQLLDFRKLEEQELSLNKTTGDIIHFIKDISFSFSDIAENKQIVFSFNSSVDSVFTSFDHDKLERILFNLLSNAFKFTPIGGVINVLTEVITVDNQKMLQLKVIDTGIGISKDKQEKIFDRFYQNTIPGSIVNQGSGIGLSIIKEFIKLHEGTIEVESDVDKGSCFIVFLPITIVEQAENLPCKAEALQEHNIENNIFDNELAIKPKSVHNKKKSLLLVEDNIDFRNYIKDNLKDYYNITEAPNGKIGWQKTLSEHPDLVLCDINMPEMNGIDLCKKIKADSRTNFIPVILLTALTGEEQQLAGLQTGANDYMTKPFNFDILLSKIQNLLFQQDSFKKIYQKQVEVKASEMEVTESADEKFIKQALAVIEKNISNADFSVEEMSREMFMSRVALYKKLFSLSGKTPIEFIRSVRLKRALQLLEKREMTVAEVAYEVGFNNPKYFTRYFKEEYNVLPSSYLSGKQKQDE